MALDPAWPQDHHMMDAHELEADLEAVAGHELPKAASMVYFCGCMVVYLDNRKFSILQL